MDKLVVKEYNPKKHDKLFGPEYPTVAADWVVTLKIDGVQAIRKDGTWMSRAGKPLYNLPNMPDGIYEVFTGDWSSTMSAVRTENGQPVPMEHLYILRPYTDRRLRYGVLTGTVRSAFLEAKKLGFEGIVLRGPDSTLLKVKDKVTYDVPVIGYQPGTGKHTGRMGALITPMGKVGTGFTDHEREEWANRWLGIATLLKNGQPGPIIEVECMELTPDGKFRHPRFVRLREDKA